MICVFLLFCSMVLDSPDVTLYPGAVSRIGNMIAAHNYHDGGYFHELQEQDTVYFYDGTWRQFEVKEVVRYTERDYRDAYLRYVQPYPLVLITCLEDDPDKGRLFVILEEICPIDYLDCRKN